MILDQIVEHKKKEVEQRKKQFPIEHILKPSTKNFKKAISQKGINIIAEIKKKSPSTGMLNNHSLPDVIKIYDQHPKVKAISVLTDQKFFGMSQESLQQVAKVTDKPLLRKEFIIDEYQILESRHYGADAILLIASILQKTKLNRFIKKAKELGMDSLVEVHTKKELELVLETDAEIIGINNRNLDTLKIDLEKVNKLAKLIPPEKIIVAESGYHSNQDITNATADAFLIGTSLLQAKDIQNKLDRLTND
ncbi:MAG: indole-3-glycerol phosphate synthase TrpC [Nanoarchaeota archaeon]|nr:indole-3-glycerol phosphate synthase TrpC [Nanoarchaeota archaeon]